ncbi:hypothetical protein ZEAMMB73_Zm00001d043316 [Zea mays]|uniref:Uncharacterized protein n=1 Tax=Zea mays TaxID=4577 RepID=A0A1D6NAH0_MAIZE|nr:hypothetical protein ZEAMMB73_Zm00001d043316 [Zea mays]
MVEEIWQELSKAKYIEWESLSRDRTCQLQKLKVACKEALTSYNSLDNPAAGAPVEQLNELEEVFKKAAKTDTPAEQFRLTRQNEERSKKVANDLAAALFVVTVEVKQVKAWLSDAQDELEASNIEADLVCISSYAS